MKVHSRIRVFVLALLELSKGFIFYARHFAQKKEQERYCVICQTHGYPLARVSFMIRTGERKGPPIEHPMPVMEFHICTRHHPDRNVREADLSAETQDFLCDHDVAAVCVYHYRDPAHVFRLG